MQRILKLFICLIVSIIVGVLSMMLVYKIPTQRVCGHILESKDFLVYQDEIERNEQVYLDDKVDATATGIMLHEAIYENPNRSLLEKSMLVSKWYVNSEEEMFKGNIKDLYDQLEGKQNCTPYEQTYARYWHGYLVPIKIMLNFLNLEEIFKLNGIVIMGLIVLMAILLYRNDPKKYVLVSAFVGFITLMNPFTISKSFQLADIFYITIISMMIIVYMYERNCGEKNMIYLFFFNGIAVAFFDFLTYPLVAFSVPMILYLYLYKKEFKKGLFTTIEYGLAWLAAYGGMWMSKFCLTALFTDEKIFEDAATQVTLHTTATGEWIGDQITIPHALLRNFNIATSIPMVAMYIIIIMVMFFLIRKNNPLEEKSGNNIVIGLLSLTPLAWYVAMSHHSYLHSYMTYRELGILVFGIIIQIGNNIKIREK